MRISDSLAYATAVVALNTHDFEGGIYLQAGAHASSRRMLDLDHGDLLLHSFDMMHGVDVVKGERYSLVLWFSTCEEACSQRRSPWLQHAADAGDDVAQYGLAGMHLLADLF